MHNLVTNHNVNTWLESVTRARFITYKCSEIVCGWGLAPDPTLSELIALPQIPS
jgi:hypothetical protein